MTKRLEYAFEEAAKLPESEQETFAEFLLAELHDEGKWEAAFGPMASLEIDAVGLCGDH